jgi:DNA polymerase-1
MVKDIGKIKREPVPWEEPKFAVYDDVDRACAVLRELRHLPEKRLVIDIETDVDKEDAYDHPNNYELLCIGLGYAKKRVVVIGRNALKDPVVLKLLGELLHAKELSAQNGKYDLKGLFPRIGPLGLSFDTMLASYACDERRGIHSLGTQGVEIIGTPDWKDVLEPYNPKKLGYGVIPPDVLHKYNAFDVAVTWELQDYYEEVFTEDERRVHDFLVAASNELQYVELNGIAIDLEYNTELMVKYLEVIADVRQQIIETIDDPDWSGFNPNSPKQVKEVIKGVFGINIPKKRNQQGQMAESTDEETLLLLREKCKPDTRPYLFFTRMLKHRREAKLYGTYVKGIRQRLYRGRVYSTFLLHGSTSGRLASRNPNVQNIPRESIIRDQFVPSRPDRVFVQVDYSQAELRVLTWLAQEDYFRDIFNDPTRDLFNELGPVLYGDVFNILDKAAKKEKRIRIKGYVYGLAYGREAGSIAEEFGIPYWEAQEGMDRFFGVIPNIVSYQKGVEERIRNLDDLVTPFGRHRRFYLLTPETIKTNIKEGLSFEPQSTSSDICLQAFVWSRQELKGKAWIRNLVHDSILAECQRGDEDYVAGVLNRNMLKSAKTVVGDYVRFATETTVGSKWGDL